MGSSLTAITEFMDSKILGVHTAYIGKVLEIFHEDNTAKIQPLTMTRQKGQPPQLQAVTTAYLSRNVIHIPALPHEGMEMYRSLQDGDIVVCIVCERDITEAIKGNPVEPTPRNHDISDSIIVGVM